MQIDIYTDKAHDAIRIRKRSIFGLICSLPFIFSVEGLKKLLICVDYLFLLNNLNVYLTQ